MYFPRIPHRFTSLHRYFPAFAVVHLVRIIYMDLPFSSSQPIRADSSTQTFSSLCRSLHRPTRPCRHFLSTEIAHTGLLVQTNVCEVTFPAHSGLTPVHKEIWRLLDFSSHIRLTPVYKDIWRLLTFCNLSGLTPVHKDNWRLLIFPSIPTFLYKVQKPAIVQQNL